MDNKSLSHSKYNCCYHVVFVPKYRRKAMYGEVRKDLVDIFKQLCQMKHVDLVDGAICKDHVHMYLSIPPKISISSFMSHLKGKSALMLFDRHPEYKEKNNKHFWARGFYCETIGNVNEETVKNYIDAQAESDRLSDE